MISNGVGRREYPAPQATLRDYKEVSSLSIPADGMKDILWLSNQSQVGSSAVNYDIPSLDGSDRREGSITISTGQSGLIEILRIRPIRPSNKAIIDEKYVGLRRDLLTVAHDGKILSGTILEQMIGQESNSSPITNGNFSISELVREVKSIARKLVE